MKSVPNYSFQAMPWFTEQPWEIYNDSSVEGRWLDLAIRGEQYKLSKEGFSKGPAIAPN